MKSINVCVIEGYVGNVEKRGSSFWSFGVCVKTVTKGEDGTWQEKPNWLNCTIGGKRGEKLVGDGAIAKGSRVVVRAHAVVNEWAGSDGKARRDVEFRVDELACIKPAGTRADR